MKFENVYELMDRFEKSNLSEISLEMDGLNVSMKKGVAASNMIQAVDTPQPVIMSAAPVPTPAAASANEEITGTVVKAAIAGTFYRAPSPDKAPFVQIGQKVKKGDALGLIEAMKMMNEITSPVDGTIEKILVDNETVVGFNDVIFVIS